MLWSVKSSNRPASEHEPPCFVARMVSLLIRTGSLASKYSISSPPTAPDIAIDALAGPPPYAAARSHPEAGHPHPVPAAFRPRPR